MRPLRKTILSSLLFAASFCGGIASAAEVVGLYDVVVGTPDKSRDSAFVEALRQVAVRVSGDRDAGVRVTQAHPDARRYVQRFSFQSDGTVSVGFDAATIEKLLTSAGLPMWGRERPAIVVWLGINEGGGRITWISAGASGPERETIDKVAKVRGLPLIWPAMDAQDLATATALVSNHALEQLTASAARYRADGALFGMATRSGAGGSNAQFTFAFAGETGERQGSLEEGVHLAADRCAKSLTVSPNVRSDVRVRVGGIVNLDAYARTLNYLEGLTIVRAVAIDQLQADVLDIRVSVRGDAALLGKTIALDRRLTVDNSPNSDGALSFNYSP